MEVETILKSLRIDGNIVYLPKIQLDRKLYLEVAKKLELIGGKWKGGKVAGFVFEQDPSDLVAQIQSGEKRNLKKEYQFFETPLDLAYRLVDFAAIEEKHRILEPSAGRGAIIKAIHLAHGTRKVVHCFELMELNRTVLKKMPGIEIVGFDFLSANGERYDRIIANPPFTKNQDIDHIYKMFECLSEGGRMVTVASTSWRTGSQKKQVAFREWLGKHNAEIVELESGTFKESGTDVSAVILIINNKVD